MMSGEELDKRLSEIEEIQNQVHDIIYNKNWFIRTFMFKKAMKLHKLANHKMEILFSDFAKGGDVQC